MESGVAKNPITDWAAYEDHLRERMGNDNKMVRLITNRAKLNPKKIVFAEADQLNVLKATQIVYEDGIGFPVLLGNKEQILDLKAELGFDADLEIIDPKTDEEAVRRNKFAKSFWEARGRRGVSKLDAEKFMRERNYFASNDG